MPVMVNLFAKIARGKMEMYASVMKRITKSRILKSVTIASMKMFELSTYCHLRYNHTCDILLNRRQESERRFGWTLSTDC